MFAPEEQQIQIYMLKSNLDEVTNEIVSQEITLLKESDNDKLFRKTSQASRNSHELNAKSEQLKLENVGLTANRLELSRQCEMVQAEIDRARAKRNDMEQDKKKMVAAIVEDVFKYTEHMSAIAERYRQTRPYDVELTMKKEADINQNRLAAIELAKDERQKEVLRLEKTLDSIKCEVPDTILDIFGNGNLEEHIKALEAETNALKQQMEHLVLLKKVRTKKF